jgi:hypothetical protein
MSVMYLVIDTLARAIMLADVLVFFVDVLGFIVKFHKTSKLFFSALLGQIFGGFIWEMPH